MFMIHDVSRKFQLSFQQEGALPNLSQLLLFPALPESWFRTEFIPKVSLPSELFDVGSKCFKQKERHDRQPILPY